MWLKIIIISTIVLGIALIINRVVVKKLPIKAREVILMVLLAVCVVLVITNIWLLITSFYEQVGIGASIFSLIISLFISAEIGYDFYRLKKENVKK